MKVLGVVFEDFGYPREQLFGAPLLRDWCVDVENDEV